MPKPRIVAALITAAAVLSLGTAPSVSTATAPAADAALNPATRPNTALIPALQMPPNMDRQFNQKHAANVARAKQGNIDLLFVGDSIMQGWTSGGDWGKSTWDQDYASKYNIADFAIGYDRTQNVLWRLQNGEGEGYEPKVVELLIGTNNIGSNTPEEIIAGEKAILDDLHNRFANARILAVGIFPRGRPTDPARKDIAAINAALEKMADNKTFFYTDISKIFLNDDGTVNDNLKRDMLHPSAKGYAAWAQAVSPVLDKLLKDAGVTPKAAPATAPQ